MASNEVIQDLEAYLSNMKVTTLSEFIKLRGKVVHGFGRGSKMLGFPTANLDPRAFNDQVRGAPRGVYIGFAQLKHIPRVVSVPSEQSSEDSGSAASLSNSAERKLSDTEDMKPETISEVFPAMISIGTSPQFNDQVEDTVEAYIDHTFACDFYDDEISLLICGYIRPMGAYKSLDDLIAVIRNDVRLGNEALNTPELAVLKQDPWFYSNTTQSQVNGK